MTDALAAAQAVTTEETFDFAAAVLGRAYAEFKVPVYLNDAHAKKLIDLYKEREGLELRITKATTPSAEMVDRLAAVDEEYQQIVSDLKAEEYVVTIKGISPELQIELSDKAYEQFPREFEDHVNPITGVTSRTETVNEDREALFSTLLRQAHLVSVARPDGATDSNWQGEENLAKVKKTIANLPPLARQKIDNAINEATISVDFYQEITDEVF